MHYNYSKALNFVTKNTLKLRFFCIIRMQKCQFHKQMQLGLSIKSNISRFLIFAIANDLKKVNYCIFIIKVPTSNNCLPTNKSPNF